MLGEYLNRKGDKKPGWQTILRGIIILKTIKEGYCFMKKFFKKMWVMGSYQRERKKALELSA